MLIQQQPTPMHRVCPSSGAWIFDPPPTEAALDQIKLISNAMLKVAAAFSRGEAPPQDALNLMSELGR